MKKIVVLFGITLFLQGCTFAISPAMSSRADTSIPFDKLQADPDSFTGKIVIVGGTIAQITTVQQGTLIEIIQRPLDYWGKPERTKRTGGRFLVLHRVPLNMMAYAPGVDLTVAGEVLGTNSPLTGDTRYDYPVLLAKELKLWERDPGSRDRPSWMDPLYDPASLGRPEL